MQRLLTASFIPAFASPGRSCSDVGDAYAARARRLLLVHLADDVSLARVQSCLVLALCDAGEGAEHSAWLLLGHAVRLAQFLHLHRQDAGNGVFDGGGDPLALSSTSGPPSSSATAHEAACRTLWACFCLERLLANGRDRIAALQREDITTRLPQSDEDFIYGRDSTSCTLLCSPDLSSPAGHSHRRESLFARTTRAVDILGRAVTWHGRGGRHRDARAPWHPDMPFAQLDAALRQWRAALPRHLAYSSGNACAAIACGDGRPWCFMMMVFFQVRVYIHRMYLPFTPRAGYDPADGRSHSNREERRKKDNVTHGQAPVTAPLSRPPASRRRASSGSRPPTPLSRAPTPSPSCTTSCAPTVLPRPPACSTALPSSPPPASTPWSSSTAGPASPPSPRPPSAATASSRTWTASTTWDSTGAYQFIG